MGCAKEEFDVLVPIEAVGAVSGNGNQQQLQLEECVCAGVSEFREAPDGYSLAINPLPPGGLTEVFSMRFILDKAESPEGNTWWLVELFLEDGTFVDSGNSGSGDGDCGDSIETGWFIPVSYIQDDCVKLTTRITWRLGGASDPICKEITVDSYFGSGEYFPDPQFLPGGCIESIEKGNPCIGPDGSPIFCP